MFNSKVTRNLITYEQMESIYRNSIRCIKGEITKEVAAINAFKESGANISTTKNTIANFKNMLIGEIYPLYCGYRHTMYNVERLIQDFPDKYDNIIKSLNLYQEKRPNRKIIDFIEKIKSKTKKNLLLK